MFRFKKIDIDCRTWLNKGLKLLNLIVGLVICLEIVWRIVGN